MTFCYMYVCMYVINMKEGLNFKLNLLNDPLKERAQKDEPNLYFR